MTEGSRSRSGSVSIPLSNGSGSRRTKNMWIPDPDPQHCRIPILNIRWRCYDEVLGLNGFCIIYRRMAAWHSDILLYTTLQTQETVTVTSYSTWRFVTRTCCQCWGSESVGSICVAPGSGSVSTRYGSGSFYHQVNYFSYEVLQKKIWANFQRIIKLFTKKIVKKLWTIWSWDPGSGKNLFRIPDQGVKKTPDPGSGSPTLTCWQFQSKKPWFILRIRLAWWGTVQLSLVITGGEHY